MLSWEKTIFIIMQASFLCSESVTGPKILRKLFYCLEIEFAQKCKNVTFLLSCRYTIGKKYPPDEVPMPGPKTCEYVRGMTKGD